MKTGYLSFKIISKSFFKCLFVYFKVNKNILITTYQPCRKFHWRKTCENRWLKVVLIGMKYLNFFCEMKRVLMFVCCSIWKMDLFTAWCFCFSFFLFCTFFFSFLLLFLFYFLVFLPPNQQRYSLGIVIFSFISFIFFHRTMAGASNSVRNVSVCIDKDSQNRTELLEPGESVIRKQILLPISCVTWYKLNWCWSVDEIIYSKKPNI